MVPSKLFRLVNVVLVCVVVRTVPLNKLIPRQVRMFFITNCRGIRRK